MAASMIGQNDSALILAMAKSFFDQSNIMRGVNKQQRSQLDRDERCVKHSESDRAHRKQPLVTVGQQGLIIVLVRGKRSNDAACRHPTGWAILNNKHAFDRHNRDAL